MELAQEIAWTSDHLQLEPVGEANGISERRADGERQQSKERAIRCEGQCSGLADRDIEGGAI